MAIYRTSEVADDLQFGYWHDVICRHFVLAESRLERTRAFPASFQTQGLGAFQISRLSAPRHFWSRTADNLRREPHDEFLLSLKLAGSTCLGQGGRQVEQEAGDLALYDTGRPFSYLLDSDIVLLKIPRREIEGRVVDVDRFTAAAFGRRSPVGQLAARLVRESLDLDLAANDAAAERMGECVVDAVSAAIEWELAERGAPRPSERTALLGSVKAYVLSHLGNRALDAARLAERHGISVRTLNRLFAAEGTTPMRWVWAQRLEACRIALDRKGAHRVTDVALDYGFADPSHFSRAFKAAYGIRPGDLARGR